MAQFKRVKLILVGFALAMTAITPPAFADGEGVMEENTCTALAHTRAVTELPAATQTVRTSTTSSSGAATTTR